MSERMENHVNIGVLVPMSHNHPYVVYYMKGRESDARRDAAGAAAQVPVRAWGYMDKPGWGVWPFFL